MLLRHLPHQSQGVVEVPADLQHLRAVKHGLGQLAEGDLPFRDQDARCLLAAYAADAEVFPGGADDGLASAQRLADRDGRPDPEGPRGAEPIGGTPRTEAEVLEPVGG
jgi:hypothetical protein